jgi:hypothetical protein
MFKRVVLTQTGVDVESSLVIPTGLTVDGRLGWSITRMRAIWNNMSSIPPTVVSATLNVQLNTEVGSQLFSDVDSIGMISYKLRGIAASTSANQLFPMVEYVLMEPRLTVEPNLILLLASGTTGLANAVSFEFQYEQVKLSDMDVMRLLQGGV